MKAPIAATQYCPGCKNDKTIHFFNPSTWGKPRALCAKCQGEACKRYQSRNATAIHGTWRCTNGKFFLKRSST